MFGLRNRRRPRAAARRASAVRAAVTPVVAECLEQRLVLSAVVSVWVESIQSTAEATPQQAPGKFRFHAAACSGTGVPASVTVTFQLSGTANSGGQCGGSADYTGDLLSGTVDVPVNGSTDVTFDAIDDQEVEPTENVIVTLDDGGDAYFVPPEGFTGRAAAADIADNDVNVWVEASDDSASEDGRDPATFTIHRVGLMSEDLTVYYTLDGSATAGTLEEGDVVTPSDADYYPTPAPQTGGGGRSVVIPAGQATASVTIMPLNDMVDEVPESINLSLAAGPGYTLSDSQPTTALAMLASLRLKKVEFVDDAPTGTYDLNALVNQLGDSDPTKRDDAHQKIRGLLDQKPELEGDLRTRLNDEENPSIKTQLQSILDSFTSAVVRLVSRGDFKISLKLAKPVPAGSTAKVTYTNAEGPADFTLAGKGDLVAGETALPDIVILPLKSGKGVIRVTVDITDAAGNTTTSIQDIHIEIDTRPAA